MKKRFGPLANAWEGVRTHKLRSSLTILGIVIGVAAVISLMSIGKGVEAEITSSIETLGSDLIFISPGATSGFGGIRGAGGSAQTLTQEDAEAISEQVPYISSVAPSFSSYLQLIVGGENMNAQVTGVPPEYQGIQNLDIANGAFFTEYDYQRGAKVAVLGSTVKETLFSSVDPIGQQIRMGNNVVRVIGVLESKGGMMGMGSTTDNAILIPLTAMRQMVAQPLTTQGERVVSSIALTVSKEGEASYVADEITSLLRSRHQLGTLDDDDFTITSMEEIASTVSEVTGMMTLFLGAIAGIALLVGGIGVMNIMLVSVVERTREIGIRKALGARERDISSQFLIEAAFLSSIGGIVGIAIGWAISAIIGGMWLIPTLVSADIVLLAVGVSVGIGLAFGFFPARQASRLNPIEALRAE